MSMAGARPMPGLPGVTVERNVPSVVRDGTTLMADIYRPAGDGPFPVILIRLPYDKTQAENISYAHPAWYAQHGYIVVVQDTRGRYASDGEWYPFRHEAEDGYDSIEWAAKLPGANGRVGMYGFSYAGATQFLPATLRPPSLVTICPAMTGVAILRGLDLQPGRVRAGLRRLMGDQSRRSTSPAPWRRRGDGRSYATAFAGAMGWHWYLPLNDHPAARRRGYALLPRLAGPPDLRRLLAAWSIDEDYGRIDDPGAARRGLVRHLPRRHGQEFRRAPPRGGIPRMRARNQKLVIGPWYHIPWKPFVGQASEGRGAERRRRLAAPLVRPVPEDSRTPASWTRR